MIKGPVNSIISSAWPNQTYSHILSYWLIVCGYEISANRRAVRLSALASFQYTTTTNYTNDRALSRIKYEYSLRDWAVPHTGLECLFPINYNSGHRCTRNYTIERPLSRRYRKNLLSEKWLPIFRITSSEQEINSQKCYAMLIKSLKVDAIKTIKFRTSKTRDLRRTEF